ncbi:Cold shock-like protein CspA [Pseudovibrio axinellae]|uniref:Cold shock-like protein CspA n=1 Tax=Pseudovibrio axinellae TaxID=989403 RepID=A0A166AV09_9HYPH|nr:cold-shock protein [Pseudovibrio axinellae]KZL21586.1 Cold shock-like protein CspA [Pseudovibrio axinellae]SER10619.1 cold shock protein (beta-ribbon, CspA family) [Pseudovibrio axinellae]
MHNGNSGRRPRSKRGGKREFGDSQNFGPEFGAPVYFPNDSERDAFAPPSRENERRSPYGNRNPGGYGGDRNNSYQASGSGDNDRGGYANREGGGGGGNFRDGPNGGGGGRRSYPPVERGPRQLGVVKFFKLDKGFGFITPDVGEADVFVHISAVERSGLTTLDSGQRISFETEPDRRGKGPKAVELRLEDGPTASSEESQAEPEMSNDLDSVGQD